MEAYNNKPVWPTNVGEIWLGKWGYSGMGLSVNGYLSDIRIWNKARTLQEILNDKDSRLIGNEPNLIA